MEKNKVLKYSLILVAWLVVLMVLNGLFSLLMQAGESGGLPGHLHFHLALTALIFKTVFIVVMIFFMLPQFSKKRNLALFVLQSMACLATCFLTEQYVQAYLARLYGHGQVYGVFKNPFWVFNLVLYVFFLLIICSYHFAREWLRNEKQRRELIENQLYTELKYLKSQVNPHFLFNTLNNLFSIAQRNQDDETANGISKLAGLMRYMLYDSSVSKISLEKELKNIQNFIALSKLRYPAEEVIIELHTSGNVEQAVIAPMLLLPFVENAFKHGIAIEKTSTISITLDAQHEKIVFTCSNPLLEPNRMPDDTYGGTGLENVKRRLALLYPQKHVLTIADKGNVFQVHLELTI